MKTSYGGRSPTIGDLKNQNNLFFPIVTNVFRQIRTVITNEKRNTFSSPVRWQRLCIERYLKMASEENMECNFNLNKIKENVALFMEIIHEYPTIYNRASKDFKDRNKTNCWKMVAQRLCKSMECVKRRNKTIRTEFSQYLSKRRGKSGSEVDDVVLDKTNMWTKSIAIWGNLDPFALISMVYQLPPESSLQLLAKEKTLVWEVTNNIGLVFS